MSITAAFLDPSNDDLFTTVASFANARRLAAYGPSESRRI